MLTLTMHNTECDIDISTYRINLQASKALRGLITMGVHLTSLQRTKKTFQGVFLVRELQTVNKKFILRFLYDQLHDTIQKHTKLTEAWNIFQRITHESNR